MDSKYSKPFIVESRWWVYGMYTSKFFQIFSMFENVHYKMLKIKKLPVGVLIAYRFKIPKV